MTLTATLLALTFLATLAVTQLIMIYALQHDKLDVPNARSSHSTPTPNGGGAAIVLCFLSAFGFLCYIEKITFESFLAIEVGGLLIAAVGFWDDFRELPRKLRLITHFIASIFGIYIVGGLPPIPLPWFEIDLGWFGHFVAVFSLVWWLNLFNFMDGIDGIAGSEAVIITIGAATIIFLLTGWSDLSIALILLSASTLGFLVLNWPPAKIFMGDVGSGFLGYATGMLALISIAEGKLTIWTWMILGGVFLSDASVTLVRRFVRGEQWFDTPHCSHAYQKLSKLWRSHGKVTSCVIAIDLLWLVPLAWLASWKPELGLPLVFIALTPLGIIAVKV